MKPDKPFIAALAGLILASLGIVTCIESDTPQLTTATPEQIAYTEYQFGEQLPQVSNQASSIQTSFDSLDSPVIQVQYTDDGCSGGCDGGCPECGISNTGFDLGARQGLGAHQGFSPNGTCNDCGACSDCGGNLVPANAAPARIGKTGLKGKLHHKKVPELSHTCQPRSFQAPGPVKSILGVNEYVGRGLGREPTFNDSQLVPWEMFSYGEYIGPHRTPHVPEYRLRVDDQLEFVFYLTRRQSATPYRIFVGDIIRISSATDSEINQREINVLSDGMVSLPLIGQVRAAQKTISDLQDELNELYGKFLTDPAILVQVVQGDTPLTDILDSVDARGGVGGRLRQATVSPDGTVQLPAIGSVPAVGLTLDEIRREISARYREQVPGLEVTPVLVERAPRFIYVVGEVETPGRFELLGPTTALQAIALAEGDLQGGNLRNIFVLRRDEAWRLTATRLDLSGTFFGRRPLPTDEIFLRDSDIIVVPRKPIQRISEAVDLYLTSTLYSIFPEQLIFDLDGFGGVN